MELTSIKHRLRAIDIAYERSKQIRLIPHIIGSATFGKEMTRKGERDVDDESSPIKSE